MLLQRVGKSSIHLPMISLSLSTGSANGETARSMLSWAKNAGIIHWDLCSDTPENQELAVQRFNTLEKGLLHPESLFLSAGINPEEYPFYRSAGKKGIRHQIDSLLKSTGRDYLDCFFLSDPQGDTAHKESAHALAEEIHRGRVLYPGIKGYNTSDSQALIDLLADCGIPLLLHQRAYSPAERDVERTLDHLLEVSHAGLIAQNCLQWPAHSHEDMKRLAQQREQNMNQLSLAWVLRQKYVVSGMVPLEELEHLQDLALSLNNLSFTKDERKKIKSCITA